MIIFYGYLIFPGKAYSTVIYIFSTQLSGNWNSRTAHSTDKPNWQSRHVNVYRETLNLFLVTFRDAVVWMPVSPCPQFTCWNPHSQRRWGLWEVLTSQSRTLMTVVVSYQAGSWELPRSPTVRAQTEGAAVNHGESSPDHTGIPISDFEPQNCEQHLLAVPTD